jgi:hypothetical protein
MRSGDVVTLEDLISDDLQFVTLGGVLLTKEDDLSAHRTVIFRIQKLEMSQQMIKTFEDTAIVTVLAEMEATYSGQPISGKFRFGRTWHKMGDSWKIIAGFCSKISD